MKHIRNWKIYKADVNLTTALEVLKNQKVIGHDAPIAIRFRDHGKIIESYESNLTFNINECTNPLWEILIPDTDEEAKNKKMKKLLMESNYSGLKHQKIENMTNSEIWDYIEDHLTDDQKYRMMLYFFDNKIYKKN